MRLQNLLQPHLVKLDLVERKRIGAIREVTELLRGDARVADFDKFYQDLLARERIETTCLGCDTALPHARTDRVSEMVLAAGRSAEGIVFDDPEHTARFIFVVGTPKRMATDYLRIVGTLARLLKEPALRAQLGAAATPEEFIGILAEGERKL